MRRAVLLTVSLIALVWTLGNPTQGMASGYIDETIFVDDGQATGTSYDPAWVDTSDDGERVAFMGYWLRNSVWGVQAFVRDMRTGEIELVSREDGPDGAPLPEGEGAHPNGLFMSGNGRFVGFDTEDQLVPEDTNGLQDVYVRDTELDRTILVSRGPGLDGAIGDGFSGQGSISDDGRRVLFNSSAGNFSDLTQSGANVFLRDLHTGETTLVNCMGDPCAGGTPWAAVGHPGTHALSGDGTHAAYLTAIPDHGLQIVVKDLVSGTIEIATRADGPDGVLASGVPGPYALNQDGSVIAFSAKSSVDLTALPTNNTWQVYARDFDTGSTVLASRADGPSGAPQEAPYPSDVTVTDDGSTVAFTTYARNLSPLAEDGEAQAYTRSLGSSRTRLVSRQDGGFGLPVDFGVTGVSSVLSGGGDFVLFTSVRPGTSTGDIFRRQLTGSPAPPETGEKLQLAPDQGTVEVRIPGSPVFEELERGTQIPIGSTIDATGGALEVLSEDPDPDEPLRHMVWSDGAFEIDQGTGSEALTVAELTGPLVGCDEPESITPKELKQMGGRPGPDVPIPGRKAWGKGGKGHQSKGGKSSSSVRGTEWLVWDTCDERTVTYVLEGRVEVDDFERGRTVFVDPGEIYVAPGPPDAAITSGPSGTITNSTPSFWFSAMAGESWSSFECRMDEGAWAPCSSPMTSPELQPGQHSFSVRAADDAGSTGIAPAVRSFRVDREATPQPPVIDPPVDLDSTAPTTKLGSAPKGKLVVGGRGSAEARFRFSADEEGSRFECSLDDSGWRRCSSPKDYRLRPGRHRFSVRAIDPTGNVDTTPERRSVRVVPRQ